MVWLESNGICARLKEVEEELAIHLKEVGLSNISTKLNLILLLPYRLLRTRIGKSVLVEGSIWSDHIVKISRHDEHPSFGGGKVGRSGAPSDVDTAIVLDHTQAVVGVVQLVSNLSW